MQQKSQETVIVLGAAGFIGRHTSQVFSRQGYKVVGIGHGAWEEREWRKWGLSAWMESDISLESLDIVASNGGPKCIVHCGGSGAVSFSYQNPLGDFQRATQSTACVLEWIRLNALLECRLVLVSSAAVYGDQGDSDASESSVKSPISPYGVHKLTAEALCESYSRFFGVSSSIVRLFSVYGEGLRKQLMWDALNKFSRGESEFFGTGHELRDWIHVEDAASLLALAGIEQQAIFEVYNGGSEHATTSAVLMRLAHASGYKNSISFNNDNPKGNPRRLTSDWSHAARLLKWSPGIRLDDGIDRYTSWFREL